ncbi:isoleucine--tRNA ligase [Candidatus Micrarchaeota archaeon]|nr:isoleucine--tRNA ligase [Candidatus Micrarchaeota archaeon]
MTSKTIPELELEVLEKWDKENTFLTSVEHRKGKTPFVFVEGPPTANGLPHPGHVLTRAHKDLVLRYKTMKGFYVPRKAGWDTHGLPVELEVEKALGLKNKKGIEEYGVAAFNEKCKESVFKYEGAWKEMSKRVGFWIRFNDAYITFDSNYVESVWWSLKQIWDKGLLYEGYKIVPLCPRCGTALSSHEVGQGYKDVTDVSVYAKFKLKDEDAFLLAWTTTPWTLFGVVGLAVRKDFTYVLAEFEGQKYYVAEPLLESALENAKVLKKVKGSELIGREFEQLLKDIPVKEKAFFVIHADYVSQEDGTGIVTQAGAYGEEDYNNCVKNKLPIVSYVNETGEFDDQISWLKGLFFTKANNEVLKHLEENDLIVKKKPYLHSYPHCWRCDTKLMYIARKSWFVKMTQVREQLISNNNKIAWYPDTIRTGRFGLFLNEVKDWALSRNRYWGTPLPIWVAEDGEKICIGSFDELKKLAKNYPAKFDPHKPVVDEIILAKDGKEFKRVPEVIDCWYDSGSAPFAQWHYPFENKELFKQNFPASFIVEGIDQTRGWFYTLHALGTVLFDSPAYDSCVVLGHVLDKNGIKMSKSKGNVVSPDAMFEKYGADALRWSLFTGNPPWEPTKFSEDTVAEAYNRFISTLYNSLVYYETYSQAYGFKHSKLASKNTLDEWIVSRLNSTIVLVEAELSIHNVHKASRALEEFVLNDLSNWFIRRSRDRFTSQEKNDDSTQAFETLRYCLKQIALTIAPFTPFLAELVWLRVGESESVHLQDYPVPQKSSEELEKQMTELRLLVEAGRKIRAQSSLKQKQPLAKAVLVGVELSKELSEVLAGELNVKKIDFADSAGSELEQGFVFTELSEGKLLYLETILTPELKAEGLFNELARNIQEARKKSGKKITDVIEFAAINGLSKDQQELISPLLQKLASDVKAKKIVFEEKQGFNHECKVGEAKITVTI